MVRIELKNGYYIEIKPKCYILKQEYVGKCKDGKAKEAVKTCGHFPNVKDAIKKYIFLTQLDVLDGERLSLEQYIRMIEQINTVALQGLESILNKFDVK